MDFFGKGITEDSDEEDIIQEGDFLGEYESEKSIEEEAPVEAVAQESRLFADYAKDVGKTSRMTRDDEKRFGALLHVYAGKIENYKRLMECVSKKSAQYKKYKKLFDNCRSRYERIRNTFVSRNLRLVMMFAVRYKNSRIGASYPMTDMIQMGNVGLMKAVERFDWRKGYTFGTYASWWIIQAITRGIPEQEKFIRIPAWALERSKKVFAIADDMRSKKDPFSYGEIAKRAGLPMEAVQDILGYTHDSRIQSLDEPITDGHRKHTLHDILPDKNAISDSNTIQNDLKETIKDALSHLSERERDILEMRLGFKGVEDHATLDTIGKKYNLTRERIRQIQDSAFKKIKNNPRIMRNLYTFWEK